jgi:hypothetical protein
MKLVSGRTGATEVNGGVVEQRLDPLQRRVTAALLAYHILQELAKHLVDGGPALGCQGSSLAQEVFLNDQGHIQSFHRSISSEPSRPPTSAPERVIDRPLKGQGFVELCLVLRAPGDIAGQPASPLIDSNCGFEDLEHGRVDALPPSLAEALQSPSNLIRYAADRQLLGHDSTII